MVLVTEHRSDLNDSIYIHTDSHLMDVSSYRRVITHGGNDCFSNIMFAGIN